ncbi:hypothetical protein I3843_16G108600 [Carya illinoinensis]|nr:hypothetical protein I3843_16G108600 [Carya illinoinensis]
MPLPYHLLPHSLYAYLFSLSLSLSLSPSLEREGAVEIDGGIGSIGQIEPKLEPAFASERRLGSDYSDCLTYCAETETIVQDRGS